MTELNDLFQNKAGRVNEVCKEWLVREDGALAYRLQSEEITEHYKGNRHRNAVVRQDFPTALHEQIKEKENAERQAALYHQMINEQEETDALIAKDLAEKLKRENDIDRLHLLQQSEIMARQLQEAVLREKKPSKHIKSNDYPIPPRHLKPQQQQQQQQQQQHHQQQQSQQHSPPLPDSEIYYSIPEQYEHNFSQHKNNPTTTSIQNSQLNYVSLDLNTPKINQLPQKSALQQTPYTQIAIGQNHQSSSKTVHQQQQQQFTTPEKNHNKHQQQQQINLHSHTPEKNYQNGFNNSSSSSGSQTNNLKSRKYDFTFDHENEMNYTGKYQLEHNNSLLTDLSIGINSVNKLRQQQDITDSIRQYNLPLDDLLTTPPPPPQPLLPLSLTSTSTSSTITTTANNINQLKQYNLSYHNVDDDNYKNTNTNFKKLSPEKYDYLMGNIQISSNIIKNQSSDQQILTNTNINNGNHLDKELNDHERIKTLQELGLPPEEIKEIDRRVQQEKRDEELARKLQREESVELNQEERDRLLAMEAQDKELARMLQEREKLKAKRAKEKARLKKIQQLQTDFQKNHSDEVLPLPDDYPPNNHSRSTSDPIDIDGESYSSPIDLIPPNEASFINHPPPLLQQRKPPNTWEYYHPRENSLNNSQGQYLREQFQDENYSNPVDMLRVSSNENGANPKIPINIKKASTGAIKREDEIYILPIVGASANNSGEYQGPIRPNQLDLRGPLNRPAVSRAHIPPDGSDNIAAMIDPTFPSSGSTSTTPGTGISSPPDISEYSDQSSSPPPYMPIQGTRRNTSLENKKKKSKDKCTHQ